MMEIDADSDGVGARVLVRDFGAGIQPRSIAVEERTLGLGLPLIATLSRSFNIRGGPDLGLEVEMVFAPATTRTSTRSTTSGPRAPTTPPRPHRRRRC